MGGRRRDRHQLGELGADAAGHRLQVDPRGGGPRAGGAPRSLSVTSPDTVLMCRPPSGSRSRSAVTSPLTEFTSSRSSQPSASARSPATVLKLSLPLIPWASSTPDTVCASTSPVTPSSVISPDTPLTDALPSIPLSTAVALTTPTCTGQVRGTVSVTVAEGRCGRSHFSRPSQVRFSWVMVSTPSSHVTSSGSPLTLATSSDGLASVASTATEPEMSLTRRPVTSSRSRLAGASMVQCAIRPSFPVRLPVQLTIYLI